MVLNKKVMKMSRFNRKRNRKLRRVALREAINDDRRRRSWVKKVKREQQSRKAIEPFRVDDRWLI